MKLTYHIDQIDQIAQKIINTSDHKHFIFDAPMGAGKTTLIKCLCQLLGVNEEEISSPTFSLVNEYKNSNDQRIYHFDLYRIDEPDELLQIGIEDYLYSNAYCFIEWPEHIIEHLEEYTLVKIDIIDEEKRVLIIDKIGS